MDGPSNQVKQCVNIGEIRGYETVGGVNGSLSAGGLISECINNGNIISKGEDLGGIVGRLMGRVEKCQNTGEIKGDNVHTGGIVGWLNPGCIINDCVNKGIINGTTEIGGIVGRAQANTQVNNCTNIGTVTGNSYIGRHGRFFIRSGK